MNRTDVQAEMDGVKDPATRRVMVAMLEDHGVVRPGHDDPLAYADRVLKPEIKAGMIILAKRYVHAVEASDGEG